MTLPWQAPTPNDINLTWNLPLNYICSTNSPGIIRISTPSLLIFIFIFIFIEGKGQSRTIIINSFNLKRTFLNSQPIQTIGKVSTKWKAKKEQRNVAKGCEDNLLIHTSLPFYYWFHCESCINIMIVLTRTIEGTTSQRGPWPEEQNCDGNNALLLGGGYWKAIGGSVLNQFREDYYYDGARRENEV